jgi:hypothetical protein
MNEREKKVAIVTGVLVALFIVYWFWYLPWEQKRTELLEARRKLESQLNDTNRIIGQRKAAEAAWKPLDAALKKQSEQEDVSLALIGDMIGLTQSVGMNLSVNNSHASDIANGPVVERGKTRTPMYREHILETKFDGSYDQFLELLSKISDADGLLRTRRVTIRSEYEKSPKLDVELRVTSIERKRS